MATEITNSNLQEVLSSGKPVIIDFWAEWCGPCRMVAPIVEELAAEYSEQAIIGKCDVDSNNDIATTYGIRNIPTILFIKGGEVVDKQIGAASKADIEAKLKALL